jgi:hypothetical protein
MNLQELSNVNDFLTQAQQGVETNAISIAVFQKEWTFLADSENKLIALITGKELPPDAPGDAEYGLILYWLNDKKIDIFYALLKKLGMPASNIASLGTLWDDFYNTVAHGPGVIMSDGTMISTVKYASADVEWMWAYLCYMRSRYAKDIPWPFSIPILPFINNPKQLDLTQQDTVTIAVMGDWGTGVWRDGDKASDLCPAELVSTAIKGLATCPDVVIHLGDVYYNGSAGQESENLLNLWESGSQGSFTLNSNHEMYDGVEGYYKVALSNYKTNPFLIQQGTSFFSVTTAGWIIFGLDSAYYDKSALYANGALTDNDQLTFISTVLAQPGNAGKKIIVMTHHNAVSYDATALNTYNNGTESLANDIYNALGKRMPDYWYYGHLHNGIVYDSEVLKDSNIFGPVGGGLTANLRCLGHGAIPFGKAYGLDGNPVALYSSQTGMPNANPRQTNRVLNGFAVITLGTSGSITEQVYEVANATGGGVDTQLAWCS